jgi:gamma-glutamyltranspeptidase
MADGGSAIEAAVATAAALGVTCPHLTGMGGDAVWLVQRPGEAPLAIMGCGSAGSGALAEGDSLAPNTIAGAVSSWQAALALPGTSRLGLHRVLRDAIDLAADGVPVAQGLRCAIEAKREELSMVPGWTEAFDAPNGVIRNPRLARTMEMLRTKGLHSFYTNGIADEIAADLADVGAAVSADDLRFHRARVEKPVTLRLEACSIVSAPCTLAEAPCNGAWIGAADADGCVVSMVQGLRSTFGSGTVLPRTGMVWQTRGEDLHADVGQLPLHAPGPSLARFDDGRVMAFGAMGDEDQRRTQAAIFHRYALDGVKLGEAVAGGLPAAGYAGASQAGAIVRHADGAMDAAAEPRSDASVAWA